MMYAADTKGGDIVGIGTDCLRAREKNIGHLLRGTLPASDDVKTV